MYLLAANCREMEVLPELQASGLLTGEEVRSSDGMAWEPHLIPTYNNLQCTANALKYTTSYPKCYASQTWIVCSSLPSGDSRRNTLPVSNPRSNSRETVYIVETRSSSPHLPP